MTHLQVGTPAPPFSGTDQNGRTIHSADLLGNNIILFFYPKDNTPACTEQVCNLRDYHQQWLQKGYLPIGISPDSVRKHKNFADKFGVNYPLIADTERQIIDTYGVWGEKKFWGRTYFGVYRTTFVINRQGVITHLFTNVDTKNHTDQINNALLDIKA